MPLPLVWTEAADCRLKRLRAAGATWAEIAADLRLNRSTVIARGMRIGARAPLAGCHGGNEWIDPFRPPLPPGHAMTWGSLVAGTLLEGAAFAPEPARNAAAPHQPRLAA
jgi:hypothetical protein